MGTVRRERMLQAFGLGLVAVAACSGCAPEEPPAGPLYTRVVEGEVFDVAPVRGEFRPLLYRRGSFEYRCTECHNDFTSARRQNPDVPEHASLAAHFDHGMNTLCVNCHHPTDRNSYVDYEGNPIPSTGPARLCAKCHGPTYREWEIGIHGRQNGSWQRDNPARTKLLCIQCHDPHNPKFAPMAADPPTIRSRFDGGSTHVAERLEPETTNRREGGL